MKIKKLYIKNIGPFKEATLDFPTRKNAESGEEPVTIITGRNGAGKSIIIDAIRAALCGTGVERNIVANNDDFKIEMSLNYDGTFKTMATDKFANGVIRFSIRDTNCLGGYMTGL